jgi:hypothetical protein
MKYLIELERQKDKRCITKAKIKRAESADLKGITPTKLSCGLTATYSEMPASF